MKKTKIRKNQTYNYSNNIPNNKETSVVKGERVQVFVRIRPFNEDELEKDKTTPIEVLDTKNNAMICNFQK